jgi:uncharacterized protein (DUF1800 family)
VLTYSGRSAAGLGAADRHLVKRFSWGLTPELVADVHRAGGGLAWFEQQLKPARIPDPAAQEINSWYPWLRRPAKQVFDEDMSGVRNAWDSVTDLSRWTVARRIASNRQLFEVMVDFWSNLLNVTLFHDDALFWRADYDRVIRAHALTSFEKLLQAAITHPAMGLFLDNAFSTKDSPNENLGRELLELHTVGVDAGYTEDMVKASARMLTGYRAQVWGGHFLAFYDPKRHDTQPVTVLGFHHPNSDPDGRKATLAYLSYLARHPATAERLARRLCTKFVSDQPSDAIVQAVASAYSSHGTAIGPTLRALVTHPDFAAAAGKKVRTPTEDYVASVRALGIKLLRPKTGESFANNMYWQYSDLGQAPYEWPAPNGYPEVDAAWATAGRVLTSFTMHRDLAARWWPTEEARFPAWSSLLPAMPSTLEHVVSTVALRTMGEKPAPATLDGIARLLGISLTTRLDKDDALDYWTIRGILSSLLDSPLHMHR